jgi:hypothetical protein
MQHLREILRQKLGLRRSHREVARSLGISPSTVAGVSVDARSLGLDAAAVEALTDAELEARLYPKSPPTCLRPEPDCAALHLELRRPGVTLALLHVEFLGAHPDGLRYTAFCDRYRAWAKTLPLVMRQVHVAGDKLFVDYAGMKPTLKPPTSRGFPSSTNAMPRVSRGCSVGLPSGGGVEGGVIGAGSVARFRAPSVRAELFPAARAR